MKKLLHQRLLSLFFGMLLCIPVVFGQNQVSVKGKILDADGQPVIGAVATGTENSGKCYNFSPVFKMSGDFSKVEEVTNWEEEVN